MPAIFESQIAKKIIKAPSVRVIAVIVMWGKQKLL